MAETVGSIVIGIGAEILGLNVGATIFGIATGTVAGAIGGAILLGGSLGLQLLLAPRQTGTPAGNPSLPPPEAGHQPIKQAIPPRIVGYGRVRLSGAYVLFEANAGISYDVIAFHHGKITGVVGYYLHDDVVTVDAITGIVDVQGDGRYGSSAVKIKTRLGLATETAYTEISTPLSTIWTSAHRGDGLASLALICNQLATPTTFANTFPRQKPEPSVVADCTPIFDPRDAAQALGAPSTWLVSSNPVLQIIDFLTNADRGMGFDYATLITPSLTALMAQADLCDEQFDTAAGGSEARYTSNGSFPLDSDPADVIASILDTCDGWLSQNGDGSLVVQVGVYTSPTVTLESKHIRGYSLQYDLADEAVVNELTIDYTDPQLDYKTAPGQPWRNETDISERGKVRSQRFALPWVYSHSQARRLAKRRDNQNNATLRGTIRTTLYGIRCLGERWVNVQASDLPDLENVVIEVRGLTIDLLNAECTITFIAVNPNVIDAWDAATEEGSSPTIASKLISPAPPVPQNILSAREIFGARIDFDDPLRSDLTFQAEWRVNGSVGAFTLGVQTASTSYTSGRQKILVPSSNFAAGTIYEVKLRSFAPGASPGSAFSASTTLTIP